VLALQVGSSVFLGFIDESFVLFVAWCYESSKHLGGLFVDHRTVRESTLQVGNGATRPMSRRHA
jgi:hypothetical protein